MQADSSLDNDNQQQRWKRRYYDTLEELEAKERRWRELERLLRHLVSRLTLAADSRSQQLNRQLRDLRNAIRDGKDVLTLRPLIDEVGESIVELDKQREQKVEDRGPGRWLQQLLDGYPVPNELQRRVKQLNKRLEGLDPDQDLTPVVTELAAVFEALVVDQYQQGRQAPPAAADETSDLAPSPPTAKRGLLSNLFGGATAEQMSDQAQQTHPSDGLGEEPELDPKARKLVAPAVGELLLQLALRLPERVKRRLDITGMRRVSAKARQRKDLMPLVDTLADHIEAAYRERPKGEPVSLDETSLQSLHAAVVLLIDEIQTPDDLTTQVQSLRQRLVQGEAQPTVLVNTLHSLADIVGELCARLGAQYAEVENFLKQLTVRLQELDQGLQESGSINQARRENETRLSSALDNEVRELNQQVQRAPDLDTLKTEVRGRLESIGQHLVQFQQEAAQFDERAEARISELQSRVQELEHEGGVLKQALAEHRELALQDALTKLANRQAYDERLRQELARARRYGVSLSVVLWDVDHFKRVNDTYGHAAGDKVLKVLAETLSRYVRETDFIARYGGEEIVMLLPETSLDKAYEVADKLRQLIAGMPFHFRNAPVEITLSAGVSTYHEGDDEQSLFERADRALYRAKEQGRNRVSLEQVEP